MANATLTVRLLILLRCLDNTMAIAISTAMPSKLCKISIFLPLNKMWLYTGGYNTTLLTKFFTILLNGAQKKC